VGGGGGEGGVAVVKIIAFFCGLGFSNFEVQLEEATTARRLRALGPLMSRSHVQRYDRNSHIKAGIRLNDI
jgi:hypothetical protein